MDHFFSVQYSVDGHFHCFQVLAMVNISGVRDCRPMTFWFLSSQVIGPAVGMLDWMVAQCLPFQGTSIGVSLVALTTSHLERRVRIFPQPLQNLLFAEFLLMAILTGVSWQVFVIWICMSLIIPNVQHFSMPFSFLLKKKKKCVSKVYLLKLSSWKVTPFLMFWSIFGPRIFLRAGVIYKPAMIVSI